MDSRTFEVGDSFTSFEEFETAFKEYQRQNYVVFVRETGKKLQAHSLYKDTLIYEFVDFGCKQGMAKTRPQSLGIRPNQKSMKVGCKAKLKLCMVEENGTFVLKVRKSNLEHNNHPVNAEVAAAYPENRRIDLDDTITSLLTSSNVSTKEIRDFIWQSQAKRVLQRDIVNLKRKLSCTSASQTVEGSSDRKKLKEEVTIKEKSLATAQREEDLANLKAHGWATVEGSEALYKEFIFNNFNEAFRFITGIAMEAEKMRHYPRWFNEDTKVGITLCTRTTGKLTVKDIRLGKFIDSLVLVQCSV